MNSLGLQNIYNEKRKVILFSRKSDGTQVITEDSSLYPYYYEPDPKGKFITYDNKLAKKIICSEPKEVSERRGSNSYEADVLFTKRYIIDNIEKFERTPFRYVFLDMEILANDLPDVSKAKHPISCITTWDSYVKDYNSWFLPNWSSEEEMLDNFVDYLYSIQPDMLLGWNMINFDYPYLFNRIKDFSNRISPINKSRRGEGEDIFYPAGISIIDYLSWYKRVKKGLKSYSLDNVLEEEFGSGKVHKNVDFGTLNDEILFRNNEDVEGMVKLDKKLGLINYYNEIRISSTCLWEDLTANSKILDIVILKEAKKRNLVLPNKNKESDSQEELEGAYRRAEVGVFESVYKADVGSMYPNQMVNFCLDTQNIVEGEGENIVNIEGNCFRQNSEALLPSIARSLIQQKDVLKKTLKSLEAKNDPEAELTKKKYDALKALVNSLYGVTAFPSFRLYNFKIASSITFLARDLLKFVENETVKAGFKVIYTDTDALMYVSKDDQIDFINNLVSKWSRQYNKEVNISFDSEGKFKQILILGKCHYYGVKENSKKPEIKGMEIKRSSSSKYEAWFQEELIKKILNRSNKDEIVNWIKKEKERIKELPLLDISFPAKVSSKEYKVETIFVRALTYTKEKIPNFKLGVGELYYYLYVKDKVKNVIAIKDENTFGGLRSRINWDEMTRRNILLKASNIFEALGWGDISLLLTDQTFLI